MDDFRDAPGYVFHFKPRRLRTEIWSCTLIEPPLREGSTQIVDLPIIALRVVSCALRGSDAIRLAKDQLAREVNRGREFLSAKDVPYVACQEVSVAPTGRLGRILSEPREGLLAGDKERTRDLNVLASPTRRVQCYQGSEGFRGDPPSNPLSDEPSDEGRTCQRSWVSDEILWQESLILRSCSTMRRRSSIRADGFSTSDWSCPSA